MFWNSAKSLFRSGGANYMAVTDVSGAAVWYKEKFGVKTVNIELDDGDDCLALGFDDESCLFVIGPKGKSSGELTARLFTSRLNKARDYLLARGVFVGELQQDAQGTRFFGTRDLEGNPIEISEEP